VTGAGIGSTISPSMAAAFRSVAPAEMPRATSALNTLQRIAGALGTALFAILLPHAITASQAQHPGSVPAVASAFAGTFWAAAAYRLCGKRRRRSWPSLSCQACPHCACRPRRTTP